MRRFKSLLFLVAMWMMYTGVQAQDIHFSQFYMSPLNLNPALTGIMNCNHRLVANYRNQWSSILGANSYSTYSASYDQRIAVGRYDFFGVGASFWGDRAGEVDFSTIQGRLSGAYSKYMGGNRLTSNYLSFGVDAGFGQRSINFQKAIWSNQITSDGVDLTLGSGETDFLFEDQFMYFDMSAGLLWFTVLDENNSFYVGGAYQHLNRANMTFYRNTDAIVGADTLQERDVPLYSKITLHAGGEFMVTNRFGLVPGAVVFLQGPSMMINGGISARFFLGNQRFTNQSFQFGVWTRVANQFEGGVLMDAVILSTRFDYDRFGIGFSYDLNMSDLQAATNNNGAFEFSLNYKICGPERRGVYCPNF